MVRAQCETSDIVITSNTTWSGQVIQMTEDSRIIVKDGATLTIRSSIVTRKHSCTGYWDGIYLETTQGLQVPLKAGLVIEDGASISFSQNGIQALNGWSVITLDSAVMNDNGQMINARDPWPLAPFSTGGEENEGYRGPEMNYPIPCEYSPLPPKVTIKRNSKLAVTKYGTPNVDPIKKSRQISVMGGELSVSASRIENGQDRFAVNAINASRGKCTIRGTTIDGFWIGVYKGSDALALCVSEGLIITGSAIVNPWYHPNVQFPETAIKNTASNMFIRDNYLEGKVTLFGIGYISIFNNNIIQTTGGSNTTTVIFDPVETVKLMDNRFYQTEVDLLHNNRKTDVTCNTWEDTEYALAVSGCCGLPLSWGTMDVSSGNVWIDYKSEMWNLAAGGNINYYYFNQEPQEIFEWKAGFNPVVSGNTNEGCTYSWPEDETDLDSDDNTESNTALKDMYDDILDSIAYIITTEDTTEITIKEVIASLERELGYIVGKGWLFHTTPQEQYWSDKVNPGMVELLGLNIWWYGQEMNSIREYLRYHSDPDAGVLVEAADIVYRAIDNGKDIYTLNAVEVDSLVELAESSFGNYTNLLRNYLYMVYDEFIPWIWESPLDSLRSLQEFAQENGDDVIPVHSVFTITPNPFIDHVIVQSMDAEHVNEQCAAQLFTIDGKLLYSTLMDCAFAQLDLGSVEPGLYVLRLKNSNTGAFEILKVIKSSN